MEKKNLSDFSRIFNRKCHNFTSDIGINIRYLEEQEKYFNKLLDERGYVFLRDIYEKLGFPITRKSLKYGWFKFEDRCDSTQVSFGLDNKDKVVGFNSIILDFNCVDISKLFPLR